MSRVRKWKLYHTTQTLRRQGWPQNSKEVRDGRGRPQWGVQSPVAESGEKLHHITISCTAKKRTRCSRRAICKHKSDSVKMWLVWFCLWWDQEWEMIFGQVSKCYVWNKPNPGYTSISTIPTMKHMVVGALRSGDGFAFQEPSCQNWRENEWSETLGEITREPASVCLKRANKINK